MTPRRVLYPPTPWAQVDVSPSRPGRRVVILTASAPGPWPACLPVDVSGPLTGQGGSRRSNQKPSGERKCLLVSADHLSRLGLAVLPPGLQR